MVIKTNILTLKNKNELIYKKDVFLVIKAGVITNILDTYKNHYLDFSHQLALPGFIDTHTHIAQHDIMGKYKPDLLDWLNCYTFPEESKFNHSDYAKSICSRFYLNALSHGTTCVTAYMTIHKEACNIAFETAKKMGVRAFIGKVMMDCNCPDFLEENTEQSLEESIELYHKWHQNTPLLSYIFSPRFAPVCSLELMQKTGRFIQDHEAYLQTHLSENSNEINWIKSLYPQFKSYTDIYYQTGLMGKKSIFGHSIHLTADEIALFKKTESKIAHCPDSNFYLRSGEFDLFGIDQEQIDFALASDIGAGTSLSMPYHAKIAIYRQTKLSLDPLKAFYLMTLGGAKVLNMQDKIGSIEAGKDADMVFYKNMINDDKPEEIISKIIFTDQSSNIEKVMIHGSIVYQQGVM